MSRVRGSSGAGVVWVAPLCRSLQLRRWFGHANISTTRLYDRRKSRPEPNVQGELIHTAVGLQAVALSEI
jgi:hypothetical protein